jgi:hypothetical protein
MKILSKIKEVFIDKFPYLFVLQNLCIKHKIFIKN